METTPEPEDNLTVHEGDWVVDILHNLDSTKINEALQL